MNKAHLRVPPPKGQASWGVYVLTPMSHWLRAAGCGLSVLQLSDEGR